MRFVDDSNDTLHKRSVSYTEDDLAQQQVQQKHHNNRNSNHQPPHKGRNSARKSKKQRSQAPAVDMSIFDSIEPLSLSDVGPCEAGPYQEWLANTSHGPVVPTNTVPFTRGIFEDDLIRIPSLDSNMRWSPENPIIVVPNIGRESLARAVHSGADDQIQSAQLSILEELKKITKRKAMAQKPRDLIDENDITEKDVICERGGKSNRHDGTKKYRGMVEKFKPTYQKMTAKNDKTNLSRKIIKTIQSVGGRFLKKDEGSGCYYVLSPVETTKKVSQALREKKVLKWTQSSPPPPSPSSV